MLDWLLSPLTYQFMQRAMIAGILVGILCSVIGCYVILRSMAFLGDALAHAILPGIAIAYLLNGNLMLGALIAAVVVALGIGQISKEGTIREDSAIGILFTAALALGVALISSIRTYAVDLSHILFGDILGIGVRRSHSHRDYRGYHSCNCLSLLQTVPGDLVRSGTGCHTTLAGGMDPQYLVGPAGIDHRGIHANGGCGFGGSHAGYAARDCLSAHAAPACHDGTVCIDRRPFRDHGSVYQLLRQHCLRIGHCTDSHRILSDRLLVLPQQGKTTQADQINQIIVNLSDRQKRAPEAVP